MNTVLAYSYQETIQTLIKKCKGHVDTVNISVSGKKKKKSILNN